MKWTYQEHNFDSHTLLEAEFRINADNNFEYKWFTVTVQIGGIDRDVTDAKEIQAAIDTYKKSFEIRMREKFWSDLTNDDGYLEGA